DNPKCENPKALGASTTEENSRFVLWVPALTSFGDGVAPERYRFCCGPKSSPGSKVLLIPEKHSSVMQTPLILLNHITSGPTPPRETDSFLAQLASKCTSGNLLKPAVY
ncbi:hypothetical protein LEMLEM_LOCUS19820, partial [Lemmus lemmus]